MRQFLNTLYVTTPHAYVRLEGDTLVVEIEREKKLQVPLHHLGGLVTFGDVLISPALLHRCADDGRGVVLLDRNGRFKARLEGAVSGNILLRQAQHAAASDPGRTLELARACVAGKLRNSRQVLLRGARDAADAEDAAALRQAAKLIAGHLRRIPGSFDTDTLRGLEGDSARVYFGVFSRLIRHDRRPAFGIDGRSRRPPLDRFNALISFLYTLLTHDCRSALESVGLDPQLGYLHVVRPGRPALALDLVEEFRATLADLRIETPAATWCRSPVAISAARLSGCGLKRLAHVDQRRERHFSRSIERLRIETCRAARAATWARISAARLSGCGLKQARASRRSTRTRISAARLSGCGLKLFRRAVGRYPRRISAARLSGCGLKRRRQRGAVRPWRISAARLSGCGLKLCRRRARGRSVRFQPLD